MKKKEAKTLKIIGVLLFIIYLIAMFYFLFLAESMGRTISDRDYSYNLVLFKEIGRFITYRKTLGVMAVMTNIFGNIICFIPFGCMLPLLSTKSRSALRILLVSCELSLIIETMQLVFKVGSFDVDDLLLNTLGGLIGYIIYSLTRRLYIKIIKMKKSQSNKNH